MENKSQNTQVNKTINPTSSKTYVGGEPGLHQKPTKHDNDSKTTTIRKKHTLPQDYPKNIPKTTAYNRLQHSLQPFTTTYNHLQPLTTAYNRLQPLTTEHDTLQPLTTVYNRLQPFLTVYNRHSEWHRQLSGGQRVDWPSWRYVVTSKSCS